LKKNQKATTVLSASAQAKHIATYSLARSSNGTKMVSRQSERERKRERERERESY
jgi:hypothetical protein